MVNVCTLNFQGLATQEKQLALNRFIVDHKVDVLAAQEVSIARFKLAKGYRCVISLSFRKRGMGTMVVLREQLNILETKKSRNGRIIRLALEGMIIVEAYGFMTSPLNRVKRVVFFEKQLPEFTNRGNRQVVLLGDFNAVCHKIDGIAQLTQFKNLLELKGLVGVHRVLHPGAKANSFQNHRGKSRIDHIYVAGRDRHMVKRSEILPYNYSDHDAVVATLDLDSQVTADPITRIK